MILLPGFAGGSLVKTIVVRQCEQAFVKQPDVNLSGCGLFNNRSLRDERISNSWSTLIIHLDKNAVVVFTIQKKINIAPEETKL